MAAPPDLILLDLNLPTMNGHEVLAALKADPVLRRIPVMILTTSQVEEDKVLAYTLGAERFLIKPGTWAGYQAIAETITAFFTCPHPSVSPHLIATMSAKN
jgi:two-component system response regulator